MRLLILHLARVFGGAERTTSNLLTHLRRDRLEALVLAAPAPLQGLMPPRLDAFVDTDAYGIRGAFSTPGDLLGDARAFAGILRDLRPDMVLGMMHYSAAVAVLGARLSRTGSKAIASYRGPAYEYLKRYEQGRLRTAFLRTAIAGTARLADRVIVPSEGTAVELRRRFLGSAARTLVIPNGIDRAEVRALADEPAPGLDALPNGLPLLCVAARLSPEKDLRLLLSAFRSLQPICPASLAVVGEGPERAALEGQIAAWGLTDRVAFVGHWGNVYPYISRADLYVHTCQFEGFGYAMLEAMACGTPVVATDCPYGPREVLGGGRFGSLVPPGDAEGLARAIAALLLDSGRRLRLTALGQQRADDLSTERMAARYEAAFADLT